MMETIVSIKPLLAVLISLAVVPLIVVSGKKKNVRESWTFVAAIVKLLIILSMCGPVLEGRKIEYTLISILPELSLKFRVDSLGIMFALVASSLWILTSAYSIGYMRGLKEHAQTRYFCFFAVSLSATIGVAFSANFLTLYLFYEALSLATYPLVTHHQDEEARISGRKYLAYIMGTSIGLVLPAMLMIYHIRGTLDFNAAGLMGTEADPLTIGVLLLFCVLGFAKAGIMPFHAWLPAAMVAPTPVSALLHAVAVVKVGAFSVVRMITGIFGVKFLASLDAASIVTYLAAFTIILSSLIALYQDNLKRRLAFSTIGQLSYIVLGVSLLSPLGITGGVLHIVMHAFGKITLFFCAGAIFVATGLKNISAMSGIGKRMPVTMTAFFIGALSIIGLPPTGGFISKWHLLLGAVQGDKIVIVFLLIISSILAASYYLPIVYRAFFMTPSKELFDGKVKEAPIWCLVPLSVTAICSIILFFYTQPFLYLAKTAAEHMFK